MVPKDWKSLTVAQVAKDPVSYGVVQTGEPVHNGVPCVRVVDIASKRLNRQLMITTSQAISDGYKRTVLETGDIIIALRGVIGRAALVTADLHGCNLTRGVARLSLKRSEYLPEYVFQLINGDAFQAYIQRQANGSALQEISIATLRKATLHIPPMQEQKRIAEILGTWDRAIASAESLANIAQTEKSGLMQNLLTGVKRLDGFSNSWREISLREAFDERTEQNAGSMPLLSVSQSRGIVPQEEAGRRNISSSDVSKYKVVCAGDIAYNTMRMWQGASALSSYTGIVSPAYTVVRANPGHCAKFYSYLFKLPKVIHTFERHSQGLVSDTWNLKYPAFAAIRLRVPDDQEQQRIAALLDTCDKYLLAQTSLLEKLRYEKKLLSTQLLSGNRRVKLKIEKVA